MQIEQPSAGKYMMPIAWYFAPVGAKTFHGLNAFSAGIYDRDRPALSPDLGEQPPYGSPFYNGENVWGYVGQCRIGTDDQFANGLTAADLAAPPSPIPICCAVPRIGQLWFLRYELKPPQTVQPGVFLGPWDNMGAPTTAALLSPVPGKVAGSVPYNDPDILNGVHLRGVLQYLTAPLPAQTIVSQLWSLRVGDQFGSIGPITASLTAFIFLIDGVTGLPKLQLNFGLILGHKYHSGGVPAGERLDRLLKQVDVVYGDYLCVEIGWDYACIPFSAHKSMGTKITDGGNQVIGTFFGPNASPMSILCWPPDQGDTDVPLSGTILAFGGPTLPVGYLPCDGTLRNAVDFPALFSAIGTAWGVGGPGTFALPDLRDRAVIGTSPGALGPARPTPRALADAGGEEQHLLTIAELPSHAHNLTPVQADYGNAAGPGRIPLDATGDDGQAAASAVAGGGAAHNTMMPYAVVTWIIKT